MTTAIAWAGLQVRRCPALRRTHLTVFGPVDEERVAEVRAAIVGALAEGHRVTFDLHCLTVGRARALDELLELVAESVGP
jgi:hypothetical protein